MSKSACFHKLRTAPLTTFSFDSFLIVSILIFFLFVIFAPLQNFPLAYWAYGDWLISYSGGFVRRGLGGQAILFFADASDIPLDTVVRSTALILCCLLISLIASVIFRLNSTQAFWLFFGPCLLFPTIYDPSFYGRKDLLIILIITLHGTIVIYKYHVYRFQTYVLPFILILSTLVHELQLFFLPFHLFLIAYRGDKRIRPLTLNLLLPSLAFVLAMAHNGSPEHVAKMCKTIIQHDEKIYRIFCEWPELEGPDPKWWERGPIYHFGRRNLSELIRDQTEIFFRRPVAFQLYAILYFVNTGLTFMLFNSTLNMLKYNKYFYLFTLANITVVVLIFIGVDIGRWIVLACFHNFVVLLCASTDYQKKEASSFWTVAAIILSSVFVHVEHTAGLVHSVNDIVKSQLGQALAGGFLEMVNFLEYITS